jgi:hypothetical protein
MRGSWFQASQHTPKYDDHHLAEVLRAGALQDDLLVELAGSASGSGQELPFGAMPRVREAPAPLRLVSADLAEDGRLRRTGVDLFPVAVDPVGVERAAFAHLPFEGQLRDDPAA